MPKVTLFEKCGIPCIIIFSCLFSNYKSSTEEDHGQVLCWASNGLDRQIQNYEYTLPYIFGCLKSVVYLVILSFLAFSATISLQPKRIMDKFCVGPQTDWASRFSHVCSALYLWHHRPHQRIAE